MNRKFGIEMEIVGIDRQTALRALRAISISVQNEDYNHNTRGYWKLVSDSSVRGGFEVVSPVLHGEAGLEEARAVATALDDAGATANRSCGLHVHFDARDLTAGDIHTIVRRYARHEAEIDAFMPQSRRGSTNTYCRSVSDFLDARFESARTIEEMVRAQSGRYFKVNLQSFPRYGTVEFRQHSGTVSAAKVTSWVRFLGEFIEACKTPNPPAAAPVIEYPGLRGVQAELAGMFTESRVVILDAMCERFGWLPHTGRAAITRLRRVGLQISPVTVDGRPAYRLDSGLANRPAPQTESLWTGISEGVVRFYRNRTAVLAAVV